MIAATYTQNDVFRVEEVPVPDITEDELLVEVKASSICGTDLRIIRNGHRKLPLPEPAISRTAPSEDDLL